MKIRYEQGIHKEGSDTIPVASSKYIFITLYKDVIALIISHNSFDVRIIQ